MAGTELWQNDCQVPAALGTTVGAGNTGTGTNFGGGANNALGSVSVGAGNTFVEDNTHVPAGLSQVWKMTHGGTAQCNAFVTWATAQSDLTFQGWLYYSANPTGSSWTFGRMFSDAGYATNVFSLNVTTTGKLQVAENGGASGSSAAALTPGNGYYVVARYNQASNTCALTAYAWGSGTAVATVTITPTVSTSYTINSFRFGIGNSTAVGVGPVYWSALQIGGGGQIARQDYNAPAPTADAGIAQTAEPGQTCYIAADSSYAASGASLASFAWTQAGGTAVTLNASTSQQAYFTAPLATTSKTYTFQVTVTDSNAQTATASVTVTVPPATFYTLNNSNVWTPQTMTAL